MENNEVLGPENLKAFFEALKICQLSISGVRNIFRKSPEEITEDKLKELTDRNKDAAWAMYVEMLTRVTTQPLPAEYGDERTALSNVYSLFSTTRDILREYGRESPEFSKLAVVILNQKIRPFTTKWHRPSLERIFEDATACDEFRKDLAACQVILRGYMQALAHLAGVEDITDISGEENIMSEETNETFNEVAWKVAATQWSRILPYRGASRALLWENVEDMIPSQFSLESILGSDVYACCVKHLMQHTRTAEQFHNWIASFSNVPETFGYHMGLPPERVEQIMEEVRKKHNSTAH